MCLGFNREAVAWRSPWREPGEPRSLIASPEWGGIQIQPPGAVRLELKGQPGRQYDLETSTNLLDWAYLYTLTATSSITIYAEPKADGPISRFYRAVLR